MRIWVYIAVIGLWLLLYLLSFGYRRNERKSLNRKQHKLLPLYGMSMFLADTVLKKPVRNNANAVDDRFKKLYVREKVFPERYLYIISKLSLSLLVVLLAAFTGLAADVTSKRRNSKINYLSRGSYGEGESLYSFEAEVGTEKETVEIIVPELAYTRDEAVSVMESYEDEVLSEVLGDNKSPDHISKPLDFISSVGSEGIDVSWDVENPDVIGYDGVIGKGADADGTLTKIYAQLSLGSFSVEQIITLQVFPPEIAGGAQQILQDFVDSADPAKKNIDLPSEISGSKATYTFKADSNNGVAVLFGGVLLAVVLFVIKDRDLDKEIKKRDLQLAADYPEIVSKIMLLCKAGMSPRKAWEETVKSCGKKSNHYVYREMRLSLARMNGGIPEGKAYEEFGKRCGIHCYIRFANLLTQNLKRGSAELSKTLSGEMDNALQERKSSALKTGEEAGTKLLVPMILMLIVALVIVVIPTFMSIDAG